MKAPRRHCLILSCLLALGACQSAEDTRLENRVTELAEEVASLKKLEQDFALLQEELAAVKQRLERKSGAASPLVKKSVTLGSGHLDDPFLGPAEAPLLIMAFGDYQCKPCRLFFKSSFKQLKSDYLDSAKAKYILRDFPLASHPHAQAAARLAHCAGEQGHYWAMHDLLFDKAEEVDAGRLDDLTSSIAQLDSDKIKRCMESRRYQTEIEQDIEEGRTFGVRGVPSFFIGRLQDGNRFEGVMIRGSQPYAVLRKEIESRLGR